MGPLPACAQAAPIGYSLDRRLSRHDAPCRRRNDSRIVRGLHRVLRVRETFTRAFDTYGALVSGHPRSQSIFVCVAVPPNRAHIPQAVAVALIEEASPVRIGYRPFGLLS